MSDAKYFQQKEKSSYLVRVSKKKNLYIYILQYTEKKFFVYNFSCMDFIIIIMVATHIQRVRVWMRMSWKRLLLIDFCITDEMKKLGMRKRKAGKKFNDMRSLKKLMCWCVKVAGTFFFLVRLKKMNKNKKKILVYNFSVHSHIPGHWR